MILFHSYQLGFNDLFAKTNIIRLRVMQSIICSLGFLISKGLEILTQEKQIKKAKVSYRQSYYAPGVPLSMHCGWSSNDAQLLAYEAFLNLFDKDGDILDLGCGNGGLLDFLISNLPVRVCPYGVDFLEESIQEAKDAILPEFSANFIASNVDEFDPGKKRFRYVITSPDYTFEVNLENYIKKCFGWVEPFGKLILYDYKGSNYFQDFIVTWRNLGLGPIVTVQANLSAIVCYTKNHELLV